MEDLRVATVQFQHLPGDKAANLDIVRNYVVQAAADDVKLIVFPECCISGYWHLRKLSPVELDGVAEPIPGGPTTQALLELARTYDITIGAGLVERDTEGTLYNSYVVAMPDGRTACHRKLHCFISEHMASGDEFTVFDLPTGQRAAVLICYDNNIGENARRCALLGAEIMLAPHQTGGCDSGSPCAMGVVDRALWDARLENPQAIEEEFRGDKGRGWLMRWLPSRAHDNGMFLLFSNGVGPDDNEVRTGNAMIIDCYGRIVAETWRAQDEMLTATLDGSLRDRCTGVRWIRARRPELYGALAEATGREEDTRKVRFE